MSHEIEQEAGGGGILANKVLWICIGVGIFILVGFILPTPQSAVEVVEKYGFVNYEKEWWHFTLRNEPFPETYFDFVIE